MKAKPDYTQLDFRGNGYDRDSLCLALQEAARLLGQNVTYEALLTRTTNAFAPGFDTGNDCKELWIAEAWVSHLGPFDAACRSLGLLVEPLDLPAPPANASATDLLRAHHAACTRVVREALAAGKVVVTTGGWEHRKQGWVEPWWAGIVTEVKDDGAVLGAHLNGRTNNLLADLARGEVFAVSLCPAAPGETESQLAMLRQAVARIRALPPFSETQFTAFGVEAMDEWIGQMARVPNFCPVCQKKDGSGWKSAAKVARGMVHRSRIAAQCLRESAVGSAPAARQHLEAAAGRYERIVALLTPALADAGGAAYRGFIGDLAKQRAHAEDVLKPVKLELAAAADEMEEALADEVVLNGRTYRLEWVSPGRLAELGLAGADEVPLRSPSGPYAGHVNPLYNLHCEVGADLQAEMTDGELKRLGKNWARHWRELAEGLPPRPFALAAFCEGKLAGHIRFLPAEAARLRAVPDGVQATLRRKGTLFISAGCVDLLGAEDGLDVELVRRVTDWAGRAGYTAVDALGWSDIRVFAMWGESLPAATFVNAGYRKTAELKADQAAFGDMLKGAHGPEVRKLVADAAAAMGSAGVADPPPLALMQITFAGHKEEKPMANVRREGSRVWIEGVADAPVGYAWDMLLRGMEILLKHRGEKTSLNELMAYSGDAFNLCHSPQWQGMAYMMIPTDTLTNAVRAYGYTGEWVHSPGTKNPPDTQKVLDVLWAEVDAGRPAMAGGSADQGCGPWSVVVGYDRQNQQMCHIGTGAPCRWTGIRGINLDLSPDLGKTGAWNGRLRGKLGGRTGGWLGNLAYCLGDKTAQPSAKERVLAALKRAAELSRSPRFRAGGADFCYGEEAYREWAGSLRGLDYPTDLQKPQPKGAWDWYEMGNLDTQVDQVVRGRTAAAEFCETAAGVLGAGAESLREAARLYREEAAIAREAFAPFIPAFDGNDAPRVAWLSDKAKCRVGADAVQRMLDKERAAIAEIEKAVTPAPKDQAF